MPVGQTAHQYANASSFNEGKSFHQVFVACKCACPSVTCTCTGTPTCPAHPRASQDASLVELWPQVNRHALMLHKVHVDRS